jgi:hypothetical protein
MLYVVNLYKGKLLVRPQWYYARNWANWAIARLITNGGIVTPNGKLNGRKGFTLQALTVAMANRANNRFGNKIGKCQYANCQKIVNLLVAKGYLVAK